MIGWRIIKTTSLFMSSNKNNTKNVTILAFKICLVFTQEMTYCSTPVDFPLPDYDEVVNDPARPLNIPSRQISYQKAAYPTTPIVPTAPNCTVRMECRPDKYGIYTPIATVQTSTSPTPPGSHNYYSAVFVFDYVE